MINGKSIIGIIPARYGSKRLLKKNILPIANKPLIAWTIESAIKSKYLDCTYVSTESEIIKNIALEYGANVPFLRPANLAKDSTPSINVVLHFIDQLSKRGLYFDYLLLLQPTSPLRTEKHIDESIEMLIEKKADGIISFTQTNHPIEFTNVLPEDLSLDNFLDPVVIDKRTQDFPIRYRINGAIYISRISRILKEKSFVYKNKSYAYIMERSSSVDIDDELDFSYAQFLINNKKLI